MRRIASAVRSARSKAGPELAVYPSLKRRESTCRTTPSRSVRSGSPGSSNRAPACLMRCLARLMRLAIVASGAGVAGGGRRACGV